MCRFDPTLSPTRDRSGMKRRILQSDRPTHNFLLSIRYVLWDSFSCSLSHFARRLLRHEHWNACKSSSDAHNIGNDNQLCFTHRMHTYWVFRYNFVTNCGSIKKNWSKIWKNNIRNINASSFATPVIIGFGAAIFLNSSTGTGRKSPSMTGVHSELGLIFDLCKFRGIMQENLRKDNPVGNITASYVSRTLWRSWVNG